MNNWFTWQLAVADQASGVIEFAANWLVQSTLLIAIGLVLGIALRRKGSAVQSLIFRTTLAAVLISPLATCVLNRAGVSGWSIEVPASRLVERRAENPSDDLMAMPSNAAAIEPGLSREATRSPDPVSVAADDHRFDFATATAPQPVARVSTSVASDGDVAPQPTQLQVSGNADVGDRISWFGSLSIAIVSIWAAVSGWLLLRLSMAWRRLSRLVQAADSAEVATVELCQELAAKLKVATPRVLRLSLIHI